MPIESITGKPGNAKTAFLVDRLMNEAVKAERPLWAGGIDGLVPGYAQILKDPREWNAVKPGEVCTCHDTEDASACNAHVIPNGSLIFIDEAWKWFGHLQDASRQSTPAHVLNLAEHRHRGIDFIWTYQQPSQIFPFARGLMAEHRHLVRKFGTQYCDAYDWQELNEDVKSQAKRDGAQKSIVQIPARTFDKYKSAEMHTIKRKLPLKLLVIPVAVLAALGALWFAYSYFKPDAVAARLSASVKGTDAPQGAAAPAEGSQPAGRVVAPATTAEYLRATMPRVAAAPWSAPLYDKRSVRSDPELFCASTQAGEDASGEWQPASCSCRTEQGTKYGLDESQCRTLAKEGPVYNPYKEVRQPRNDRDRRGSDAGSSSVVMHEARGTAAEYAAAPPSSGAFALDPEGAP
jgi:zona occludens toxin